MGAKTRPHTRNIFAVVDAMNVTTVAPLFAEDRRVVFGDGQPMVGLEEIRTGIAAFFDTIAGQHHEVVKELTVGDDSVVELKGTYDRKDGKRVTIPGVTICHTDGAGKIDDYRVYFDAAPVYA